ncbi:MAG: site-specific DNA-methyltransferase [Alphaproteobacteria bacterium]|nr:site-specific DNA-methyltransferase [Alphaproteobacteria bacterium]
MNVEPRAIDSLTPYDRNAKTHPAAQVDLIRRSITEYGWTVPVLIDADGSVIAGHGRIEAAKALGMAEVPTIQLDHLTPAQVRAYRLADNKLTELGAWDDGLLSEELKRLLDDDFDLTLTGFDDAETARLLAMVNGDAPGEDDVAPDPPADPVTKPGDLWVLGRHRLVCGDATDADVVARALAGATPRLMVTDPPYGIDYDPSWRTSDIARRHVREGTTAESIVTDRVKGDTRTEWMRAILPHVSSVAVIYMWHAATMAATHYTALDALKFEVRSVIVWRKDCAVMSRGHYNNQYEPCLYAVRKGETAKWMGGTKESTVWDIHNLQGWGRKMAGEDATGHPTQKPLECMERPIRNHKGDCYEPFAGSGTTLIAAERQNRACYAIELDPGYCDVIVERWQQHTGETARREAA